MQSSFFNLLITPIRIHWQGICHFSAVVPVLSAVIILVFVTCIAAVFAVHLFSSIDSWNFGNYSLYRKLSSYNGNSCWHTLDTHNLTGSFSLSLYSMFQVKGRTLFVCFHCKIVKDSLLILFFRFQLVMAGLFPLQGPWLVTSIPIFMIPESLPILQGNCFNAILWDHAVETLASAHGS